MSKLVILFALATAFVSAVTCQTDAPSICPKVSVVGPVGITSPGEFMVFATDPPLKDGVGVSFHWTVSAGTITKGQGTQVIEVWTTREMNNSNVTATVEISGLPKDCARTSSETTFISSGFHPNQIDEFGKLPKNDIRGRLDVLFHEVLNNKDQVGFIALRRPPGSSQQRLKERSDLIKRHITFRKFPRERIVVCAEPGIKEQGEYTVIWRSARENVSYFCPNGVIL